MSTVSRAARAVLIAGTTTLLVACGGGGNSGTSGSASPSGASSPATTAGRVVTATEADFSIRLSATTFTAGTYTFIVSNQGKVAHNLNVNGPGINGESSPTLDPGTISQLTVTLQKGSYELWCSVDAHKEQGMDLTIQVG